MAQRTDHGTGSDRPASGARSLRVLVVEDHPTNRRLVQMMLEPLGFTVSFAENGKEGVEAFEREQYDIVLMDLQMPVMDGLTAIREIRLREAAEGRRRRMPIAMVSANVGVEYETAAQMAGADVHIAKPFSLEALIMGIASALEAARPGAARRSG